MQVPNENIVNATEPKIADIRDGCAAGAAADYQRLRSPGISPVEATTPLGNALADGPGEESPAEVHPVVMVAACPFPANYGTPGAIREMAETLAMLGHDVHIVTYPFGDDLPVKHAKVWRPRYWRRSASVRAGPSVEKLLLDLLVLIELCRVIRREQIKIIHAHNYEGALIGFAAKLITGRPLIYNAVSLMSDELPRYRFLRPAILARLVAALLDSFVAKVPDRFIAITAELREVFLSRGIAADRVTYIPLGVWTEMFEQSNPAPLRLRHGIGQRPVVMYTGINSPFQRIDYLLQAFSLVIREEPAALLMIVSPLRHDPDLSANRALARELGVEDSVIWVENQSLAELPDYLAMATVAVISRPEVPGHPLKLLNYMAAARPIVCFNGAAKGIRHMHDAYLVPDHDCRQMGQAIVTLLRDRELAGKLAAQARKTVITKFDWRELCREVEGVYKSVVSDKPERVIAGISQNQNAHLMQRTLR